MLERIIGLKPTVGDTIRTQLRGQKEAALSPTFGKVTAS